MKCVTWRMIVPSLFTFSALCTGVGSILAASTGNFLLSAQLIMVSLILDGLDGTMARLLRGQTGFGAELDTFVDITSFGIAPAILLYCSTLHAVPVWGLVITFLFVMSGAARLSRFRLVDPYRGQRGYLGLPITTAAAFVAVCQIGVECSVPSWGWEMNSGWMAWAFWPLLIVMLFLQISVMRYPKPTKNPAIFVPFFVALVLLFFQSLAVYSAILMMLYGLWYAFISPFFFRQFLSHLPPMDEPKEETPS